MIYFLINILINFWTGGNFDVVHFRDFRVYYDDMMNEVHSDGISCIELWSTNSRK